MDNSILLVRFPHSINLLPPYPPSSILSSSACNMKPWRLVHSFKHLKWLLTLRRACSSAYAKLKPNSSSHGGGTAGRGRRSVGVMELVDEVRECKYSDVHVMWSILKETEKRRQQQAAAMASAINHA